MNGYGWPSAASAVVALAFLGAALTAGPWIARAPPARWMRALGWALLLTAATLAPWLTHDDLAGTRLLLICSCVFLAMKVLVQAEARLAGRPVPGARAWLCFALLWPGMRPWVFAGPPGPPRRDGWRLIVRGSLTTLLGLALVGLARLRAAHGASEAEVLLEAFVGLWIAAAFGAVRALAGFWRLHGRPVAPLFDAPARSRSLTEFWARRWNLAFSEMLQVAVARPFKRVLGPGASTALCFVISGLLHELALSVPARAGYGLPLLYFSLHGLLVAVERRLPWGAGRGGELARRVWTLGWVLLPVLLVFHPPALRALVLPLVAEATQR
jgi:alginate O-acetyltransferase complex protein AlgI